MAEEKIMIKIELRFLGNRRFEDLMTKLTKNTSRFQKTESGFFND